MPNQLDFYNAALDERRAAWDATETAMKELTALKDSIETLHDEQTALRQSSRYSIEHKSKLKAYLEVVEHGAEARARAGVRLDALDAAARELLGA